MAIYIVTFSMQTKSLCCLSKIKNLTHKIKQKGKIVPSCRVSKLIIIIINFGLTIEYYWHLPVCASLSNFN